MSWLNFLVFIIISVSFVSKVDGVLPYHALFEGQFFDVTKDDWMSSGYEDTSVKLIKDERDRWYTLHIVADEGKAKRNWKELDRSTRIESNATHHAFETVELSFAFPFFGRTISKLIVTSAGAVILGNLDEPIPCPSHIAPLLSSLPPGNDTCDFAEAGGSFTVQWKKHFLHMRESFELTIYEDGSMVFIYHNLIAPLLKKAKDSGYPVLIGLQDSFAVQDKSQVHEIYMYNGVHIDPEKLISNWTMVTVEPDFYDCNTMVHSEQACSKEKECNWCQAGDKPGLCVYQLEQHRPGSPCLGQKLPKGDTCRKDCPTDGEEVCGTDGITYQNECVLKAMACKMKTNIEVDEPGECVPSNDDQLYPDCPKVCPLLHKPVCGSDSRTYANLCAMKAKSCSSGVTITKVKEGKCDENQEDYDYKDDLTDDHNNDDDTDNQANETVDINSKKTGSIDCFKKCDKKLAPVCLNDERVFNNKCLMDVVVCEENISEYRWHEGHCTQGGDEVVGGDDCEIARKQACDRMRRPVCGSNGITYANECLMKQITCSLGLGNVEKASNGPCGDRAFECPPVICTEELNPVCGSNGITYSNKCLFDAAASCSKDTLELVANAPCSSSEILKYDANLKKVDVGTLAGEKEHRRNLVAKVMKAVVLIFTCAGLGFLVFAAVRVYRRRSNSAHWYPQQPFPATSSTPAGHGVMPQPPVSGTPVVEQLGLSAPSTSGPRYDRLPLVQE